MSTNQPRIPTHLPIPDRAGAPAAPSAGQHEPAQQCRGIIPPFILEQLINSDHSRAIQPATESLMVDRRQRERRQAMRFGMVATDPGSSSASAPEAGSAGPHRSVHDCGGERDLPGRLVRDESAPAVGDVAADEAFEGLAQTWALFREAYGRDSLDGAAMPLVGSVHYGERYDNAFWNGEQMVFGDGDGVVFNRFTASVDVIGHELTHGLTQFSGDLDYHDQSGALNEHLSDVFGSLVKQRSLGQDAASADWLIGQGLFTAAVNGVALRSMKAPGTAYDDPALGKDPQPATMAGYVRTTSDNGGVHINSGIPNHAFYLLATALGGKSWIQAGQIWFDVLTGGTLRHDANFAQFAGLTITAAGARYGAESAQSRAVADAWQHVGVVITDVSSGQSGEQPSGQQPKPGEPGDFVVQLERSGGFAGQIVTRDVDLASLSPQDASSWHDLLGSRLLTELPDEAPQPDRYVYRVVCDPAGVQACAAEQQLPDHVLTLFERALSRE